MKRLVLLLFALLLVSSTTVVGVSPTNDNEPSVDPPCLEAPELEDLDSTASLEALPRELQLHQDLEWPFPKKNKTAQATCSSYETCASCTEASWCHWCGHSNSCHVIGSVHGCVRGASCEAPKPPSNDTSGCAAHTNCTACALASASCHWCAHDNSCHRVGSVYGCVTGVDCYSNDRCRRTEPELVHEFVFTDIPPMPLFVVLALGAVLLCCVSGCFCVATGVKGAYDDLAHIALDRQHRDHGDDPLLEPLLEEQAPAVTPEAAAEEAVEEDHLEEGNAEETGEVSLEPEAQPETEPTSLMVEPTSLAATSSAAPRQRRRQPRHMQRLYNACTACYIVTVAVIGASVIGSIRYYPKIPEYSICNDNVAWSSLIDSMAAAKVSADFEILASVFNPNHVGATLEMGKGTFYHDGAFVGTFDIPPVTAQPMSITDLMVIAHFTPEKWDALAITTDYYRGKLVLHVDTQLSIRVPALGGYSFSVEKKDMVVHVNEMSDRHLCHCPSWTENRTLTENELPWEWV